LPNRVYTKPQAAIVLFGGWLFKAFFESATHKIFFGRKQKPVIRGTDFAILAANQVVPFTVTIPPAEQDRS